MTTSGSVDFAVSRDQIITAAAMELGVLAEGETPSANLVADFSLRLNSWVKSLMAQGAKMWAMKQATLFLEVGESTYSLGATGDHCTDTYVQTTLSAAAVATDSTVTLTSIVGMTASDFIGIELDDGTIQWTTISGAPAAPVTLADALTGDAASGNAVFTYTSKINRPQRIVEDVANWHSFAGIDTQVNVVSREAYTRHPNKSETGKVVDIFYDKQLVNGVLKVWPTPDNATDVIQFWYERILEDFDAAANTPDFAIEWTEALILGLASRMLNSYAGRTMTAQERKELKDDANTALAIAMGYDKENVSVFFQPYNA